MTLQKLLLKLSNNKSVSTTCHCGDGECIIVIKEEFNYNELATVHINLKIKLSEQQEALNKLSSFI